MFTQLQLNHTDKFIKEPGDATLTIIYSVLVLKNSDNALSIARIKGNDLIIADPLLGQTI